MQNKIAKGFINMPSGLITTDKAELWDNLTTKQDLTHTRHSIATLIQLEHIIFRIHELEDIAVYDTKKNILKRGEIKKLIEPLIFPVLSTTEDENEIKSYFESITFQDYNNFNKMGFIHSNLPEISFKSREAIYSKIRKQKEKQKKLREFYKL